MTRRCRSGFTLIELLAVISIIGMLMSLLLPAVQSARSSTRAAVCKSNQHNLAIAISLYEGTHGAYPGYRDTLTTDAGAKIRVSWVIPLLPQLERSDLYRLWKAASGDTATGNYDFNHDANPLVYLPLMVCPSDLQAPRPVGNSQPLNYAVNAGLQDYQATAQVPGDYPENGVFMSRWEQPQQPPLQMSFVTSALVGQHDGLSHTLLLSENIEARYYDDAPGYVNHDRDNPMSGSPSNPTGEQYTTIHWTNLLEFPAGRLEASVVQEQINGRPQSGMNPSPGEAYDITYARPSSHHPGGVHATFCDGHTQFIGESLDYLVYTLLMTSDGEKSRSARNGLPNPAPFRHTPLDLSRVP